MQKPMEIKFPQQYAFEIMQSELAAFQSQLGPDQEIGIVSNGGGVTIHASRVRLADPMIVFEGVDDQGRDVRLIQHYTQAAVQFVAVDKQADEARRIGF